jgi:protein gp37/ParB-like chromosome segregation protein Spo0J
MKKTLKELRPHPLNTEIYGDGPDQTLIESVGENGVLEPILIDSSDRILSGHRRFQAAGQAGMKEVPVRIFQSTDELDIETALIESNRQRVKTNEQIAREAARLFQIERKKASRRQALGNGREELPAKSPEEGAVGDARDLAARKAGMGAKKVEQAAAVIETIDRLKREGDDAGAERIRHELNRHSINRACNVAREGGLLRNANGERTADAEDYVLISRWSKMSESLRQRELARPHRDAQFTSQQSDGIEWAKWSWNPVTGCAHGCKYCYARDIAVHLLPQGFEPSFHPGRLKAPQRMKLPKEAARDVGYRNVFTCSMADLFGKWVPAEIINLVLESIRAAPQWNFLFLTKFPQRLADFEFPENAWVGASVDCQARVEKTEQALERVKATVKWVSCEPLLERLTFSRLHLLDWLVIGGASKSTKTDESRPPREWVQHLWQQADDAKCKVYEKPNLLERRREYPLADLLQDPDRGSK